MNILVLGEVIVEVLERRVVDHELVVLRSLPTLKLLDDMRGEVVVLQVC